MYNYCADREMPRLRGGRSQRGYRARGRRGYNRGTWRRGQHPSSQPVAQIPPASTQYVSPKPPSNSYTEQSPGIVPAEQVNTALGGVPSLFSPGLVAVSQPGSQPPPPANSLGVDAHASDVNPAAATINVEEASTTSSSDIKAPTVEDSRQQQRQEDLDHPSTETQQTSTASTDLGENIDQDDKKDQERSTSPTEQYLYGPDGEDETKPPDSLLGKRKEPPSTAPASTEEGVENGEADDDEHKNANKKSKVTTPSPVLTPEVILDINKRMIGTVKNSNFNEEYVCVLCLAQINSRRNLEKHLGAGEHMRRVGCLQNPPGENIYHFCDTCFVTCLNEEVYSNHIKGKKHAKNVQLSSRIKSMVIVPLGNALEALLKKDVVKSGDGLTLGLSTNMMKFFSMEGPFVGLQYAEEVGVENDPNPGYRCTLCSVSVDGGNQALHFTSTAHRMNVLKKDYPDMFAVARETWESADKKSELSSKLKEICSEIEGREGRKVELIKRVIVSSNLQKGATRSSHFGATSYKGPYGSGSNWREGGAANANRGGYGGRGDSPWQPRQRGRGRGGNYSSFDNTQSKYGGYSDRPPRGGFNNRGRSHNNRGRGTFSQSFTSGERRNSSEFQSGYTNFEQPQQSFQGGGPTRGRGRGRFNARGRGGFVSGYNQERGGGHHNQAWSSSGPSQMSGRNPPVPPLQLNAHSPYPPTSYQHQPGQSPSFQNQSPSFQSQSPSFMQRLGQSPFGMPPPSSNPSMLPPLITPTASAYQPMPGPQHIVQSPVHRFPDQISPSSPWAPPPRPHPEHQQHGVGYGGGQQQYDGSVDQMQYQQSFSVGDGGGGVDPSSFRAPGPSVAPPHAQQGHASEAIKTLEGTVIESEEEAEQALRLSSALTQKLLAYRFKTVSNSNPIMSLLNTLQASGLQPPAP